MIGFFLFAGGCATKPARETSVAAQPVDGEYKIGKRFTLRSEILHENRNFWVYLPKSYQNTVFVPKKYPVLYILDGDVHFHSASGVVQFMSDGNNGNTQIPEMIVVAIPNTFRTRDLTPTHTTKSESGKQEPSLASSGGGEAFLNFLQNELIPHIEANYRTLPHRVLVGHSLGGLLATDVLLRQPPIFQGYIAIDPSLWWDDQLLLSKARERLQKTNDFRGAIYISVANNPPSEDFDANRAKNSCMDFASLLQTNNSSVFHSAVQYFDSENHGSVPLLSLYHGLLFLFDGYKPPGSAIDHPELLNEHFAKVSERLGVQFLPPEEMVALFGNIMLYSKRSPSKAIQWLKINVTNYPDSFSAQDNLATAYVRKGEMELALKSYEASWNLNRNRWAEDAVRRDSSANALVNIFKLGGKREDVRSFLAERLQSPEGSRLTNTGFWELHGAICARTGDWKDAATDFARLIVLEPTNHLHYHSLAPLLVATGDLKAYRRHCAAEIFRFGRTDNLNVAERMAKDCLILPFPGSDLRSIEKWADTAVILGKARPDLPFFQFVKGLVEYRQRHFSSAANWTEKVVAQPVWVFRDAQAYLVLAMAQHQLGQHAKALATLDKGIDVIETRMRSLKSGDIGDGWIDWIIVQTLRKEAEALIENPAGGRQTKSEGNGPSTPRP